MLAIVVVVGAKAVLDCGRPWKESGELLRAIERLATSAFASGRLESVAVSDLGNGIRSIAIVAGPYEFVPLALIGNLDLCFLRVGCRFLRESEWLVEVESANGTAYELLQGRSGLWFDTEAGVMSGAIGRVTLTPGSAGSAAARLWRR